jgi:DNA-binding LytR/AlgR family response regulator
MNKTNKQLLDENLRLSQEVEDLREMHENCEHNPEKHKAINSKLCETTNYKTSVNNRVENYSEKLTFGKNNDDVKKPLTSFKAGTKRVPTNNEYVYLSPDKVLIIEGYGGHSTVYYKERGKLEFCKNLKALLKIFDYPELVRIKKNIVINKEYLIAYNPKTKICKVKCGDFERELLASRWYARIAKL